VSTIWPAAAELNLESLLVAILGESVGLLHSMKLGRGIGELGEYKGGNVVYVG